eukprot:jgi/Mesvir1/23050/Mv08167-RA.1
MAAAATSAGSIALVTGGNKGIGYEIVKQLAKKGVGVVLTARNASLGVEAQKKLKEMDGVSVEFHQLDITDKESIGRCAEWLKATYGGLDILVNNAGFAYHGDVFGPEEARKTIGINYYGTVGVCDAMVPLLGARPGRRGGRIVNVASTSGKLRILKSEQLRKQFTDASLTKERLSGLMEKFIEDVRAGRHSQEGWPTSMYGISKLGMATFTRILARDLAAGREGEDRILVNACCPGYCATDMSSWRGPKSAAEGAETPGYLALLPSSGPTGKFFASLKEEEF